LKGHQVKIYEKLPELGGMIKYGIPEYRLPKHTLNQEIGIILSLGIEVEVNRELGKDFTIDSLKSDMGYDAVYIAVGAQNGSSMRIEYEDETVGVEKGVELLRRCQVDGNPELKGTVIVVGGGNTAIDAARTALRCGADKVKIVYRRSIKEMPAHEAEVKAAQEEGVEMLFLSNPKMLIRNENTLRAVECLQMELVKDEAGGRPRPVVKEGSEFTIDCTLCISAIGQNVDQGFNRSDKKCELERWGTIIVNENTFETSVNGVFAGGDAVTGPLTAVTAIGHGYKAAQAISTYLLDGEARVSAKGFYSFKHKLCDISPSEFSHEKKIKREKMPELPLEERKHNNREVELGFSEAQSLNETVRCLECGCGEYYDCVLRKYSDEYNIEIDDYVGETRKYKVDNQHPFITLDPSKCINCGRCIRTCSEMLKVSALGFVYRGFKAVARPAMESTLMETNCISCGNCIDACPTGAISEKFPHKVLGTLPKEDKESICEFCSLGCRINYKKISEDIYYISNTGSKILNRTHNRGYLCVKGRFGYRYLQDIDRLVKPLIKRKGKLVEVSLDEALAETERRIKEIIQVHGRKSIAVFASPKLSNEELYLIGKFARKGIRTNKISSFSNVILGVNQNELDKSLGMTVSTTNFDELKKSDLIIIFNTDFNDENHIVAQKIKDAARAGSTIIEINSNETKLTKFADIWVDTKRGTNTVLLNGMIREMIESGSYDQAVSGKISNFEQLKAMAAEFDRKEVLRLTDISPEVYDELLSKILNKGENISFITNMDNLKEKALYDMNAAVNFLMLRGRIGTPGNGIIILRDFSNSTGLMDMGVTGKYLPGYVGVEEKKETKRISTLWDIDLESIFDGKELTLDRIKKEVKAVLVFGENPYLNIDLVKALSGIEFLQVSDIFKSESCYEADVILPLTANPEMSGTYTSCERRVQYKGEMVKSKTEMDNLELINGLYGRFAKAYQGDLFEELSSEIRQVNRYYTDYEEGQYWGRDIFKKGYTDKVKVPEFSIFKTSTATFRQKDESLLVSENYFVTKIKGKLML
jgi:formate dehydrogenase major subunit